jgi:hypothetical protein
MPEVRLHLDADTSRKSVYKALLERGHDVTRTPADWIAFDADDERQLLAAIAQNRCLFTFNIADFTNLARAHPHHRGILFAAQKSWSVTDLIRALDRFLSEEDASDVEGRILWLNRWRS